MCVCVDVCVTSVYNIREMWIKHWRLIDVEMCFRFSFIFIAALFEHGHDHEHDGLYGEEYVTGTTATRKNYTNKYICAHEHALYTQSNNLKMCSPYRLLFRWDRTQPANDLSIIVIVCESILCRIPSFPFLTSSHTHSLTLHVIIIRCEWLLCI